MLLKSSGFEKSKVFSITECVEYASNSVIIKTIVRKITGNIHVFAFDAGEILTVKISPFDNFKQVIDGKAEIIIDGKSFFLKTGEAIITPAHSRSALKATGRFKLISTIIKSGYEEVIL